LLPPKQPENLFDSVVTTVSQLTEIRKTLQPDENSRNTIVSLLLQTRGFRVKDQTLSGLSVSGDRPGELDIKIEDKETGRSLSIIEALNLNALNTTEINHHVLKLLQQYDSCGLKENYILVYASAKDFAGLCKKYRDHLPEIDYGKYPLIEKAEIEVVPTGFHKIKTFRARHRCNDGETILYHILVEM
jgi:hypothetical protein